MSFSLLLIGVRTTAAEPLSLFSLAIGLVEFLAIAKFLCAVGGFWFSLFLPFMCSEIEQRDRLRCLPPR